MVYRKRLSGELTPPLAYMDTVYFGCNFSRPVPEEQPDGSVKGERIFPGDDTPRTFTECNLTNAEWPPGSTVIFCNTSRSREIIDRLTVYGRADEKTGEFIERERVKMKDTTPDTVTATLTPDELATVLLNRANAIEEVG